ncbi:acyl carrier protein [Nocardiopsis alba]|uniref:acyl carrier protein n=1 Tax=Nocardiopsis alba TaxID=53437 RepID=UPI00366C694F
MLTTSTIAEEVVSRIREILGDAIEDDPITVNDSLTELGFNSLMMARLIVDLEQELKIDPFSEGRISITDIHTVGEMIDAYREAENTLDDRK